MQKDSPIAFRIDVRLYQWVQLASDHAQVPAVTWSTVTNGLLIHGVVEQVMPNGNKKRFSVSTQEKVEEVFSKLTIEAVDDFLEVYTLANKSSGR